MSALLAGISILAAAASVASGVARDVEAQMPVDPMMVELTNKMDDFEDGEFRRLAPTVAGLYIHWVFSVLAMFECIIRLLIYGLIIFAWSLFIYLSCCISCGKSITMPSEPIVMYITARYSIYSAFLCAITANVLCPFAPTLYFWKRRVLLARPPGMTRKRPLARDSDQHCACSEFGHGMFLLNGINVPAWKMAEVYFSTVAILHILGDCLCRLEAWPSLCGFHANVESYLADACKAIVAVMAEDTAHFYQQAYRVDSFEAFLAARYNASQSVPSGSQSNSNSNSRSHSSESTTASAPPHAPPRPPRPSQSTVPVVHAEHQYHIGVRAEDIPVVIATPIP